MFIKCPRCKNSYKISGSIVSEEGVLMNCSKCDSSFITLPKGLTILSAPSSDWDYGLTTGSPGTISTPLLLDKEDTLQGDRFKVIAKLGRGRYGSVHKVFDRQMKMELALKVMVVPEGMAPKVMKQLSYEFQVREKIKDRFHILASYLPLLEEYKGLSLVLLPMELADGGSLRSWMDQHLDIEKRKIQALKYFKQICLGVQAIHKTELVHLDLKPENILIVKGDIKISDFGISRDLTNFRVIDPAFFHNGIGTAHYMAPEQIMAARPKDVNQLADIYALGCILFELLDGDPPYVGTSKEILEKHERGIKPDLKGVDETLTNTIFKCLSKEPNERYNSISNLLSAMGEKEEPLEKKAKGKIKESLWYYLDPEYHSQIEDRLRSDVVMIEEKETKSKNAKVVLETGCGYGFEIRNGKIVVCASTLGLLSNGNFELLEEWLAANQDTFSIEDPNYIIKLFCVDRDREGVRDKIDKLYEKGKFDLRIATILVIGYNDMESARRYLRRLGGKAKYSSVWIDCAKIWHFILRDDNEAMKCLQEGITRATDSSDWRSCAGGWKSLFDKDHKAKKCLQEAENRADFLGIAKTIELCSCAETWKFLFNANDDSKRCLKKAADRADSSSDWRVCAATWKLLFNDDREVTACITEAEQIAETVSDWKNCAQAWKYLFNKDLEAITCLKESENKADCSSDWLDCTQAWLSLLNDDHKAKACLVQAENRAKSPLDWLRCAEVWMSFDNDDPEDMKCLKEEANTAESAYELKNCTEARKSLFKKEREALNCLKEAENMADDSYDWASCAKNWKSLFNNDHESIRCIRNAEDTAESTYEWQKCAKAWKMVQNDNQKAIKCLKKAEDRAENTDECIECAISWESLLNDDYGAMRCLKEAGNKAKYSYHWEHCAKAWMSIFNNDRKAMRCLKEAKNKADSSFDWQICAEALISLFNDNREAGRCLKEGEKTARSVDDWKDCAYAWKSLFNYDHEAIRCLKEAENRVESVSDWDCCATEWKEILNNDREARRCLERAEDMVDSSVEWGILSRAWKNILNDDRESDRCKKKKETMKESNNFNFSSFRSLLDKYYQDIDDPKLLNND